MQMIAGVSKANCHVLFYRQRVFVCIVFCLVSINAGQFKMLYSSSILLAHLVQAGLMELYECLFIAAAALGERDVRLSEMLQVCTHWVCLRIG